MTIKKVFSCITAFLMIISFAVCYAETDKNNSPYAEAVEITTQLGIFINDNFEPEKNITRAETAAVITRFMGYNYNELLKGNSAFYDVAETHWALPYINILKANGIMSGDENGYFLPDENVTFNQMTKILMSAAGYSMLAETSGGYPDGYNKYALEKGLLKNVPITGDDYITRGEAAQLIYNAFDVKVILVKNTIGSITDYTTDDTTMLSKYMKIYKSNGVIKANSYTSVSSGTVNSKGKVELNGEMLSIGNTDADEYLGCNVTAYVKDDEDLKYIAAVIPKKNDIQKIAAEDFVSYKDNFITYETENGKTKKYRVTDTPDVIFNGEYKENPLDIYFEITDGKITLIDNDTDGKYDVIKIEYGISYLSDSIGEQGLVIHDLYGQDYIDYKNLSGERGITIRLDGAVIEPSNLEKYDVLDVYPSEIRKDASTGRIFADIKNSQIINIDAVRKTEEGKISSADDDSVIINGNEYKLTGALASAIKAGKTAPISASSERVFCINSYGKIAGVKYSDTSYGENYIFITKAYCNAHDINDEESFMTFRAFNLSSGDWHTYNCGNKVVLNGAGKSKASDVNKALQYNPVTGELTSAFVPQLAGVKFNGNGDITFIDTAYVNVSCEDKNDTLSLDASGSMYYKNYTLDSKIVIPTNGTVILKVPVEGSLSERKAVTSAGAEKEYDKSSYPKFSADKTYCVDAYNLNEAMASKLIIYYESQSKSDTAVGYYTQFIMVENVYEKVNDEGEITSYIKGYANGNAVDYEVLEDCTNDPKTLNRGDIIYVNKPNMGISSFKQVLDISDIKITEGKYKNKNLFASNNYGVGKAYAIVDRCLRAYFDVLPSDDEFDYTASCNLGANTFVMYDVKSNAISSVYPEDILTYTKTRSEDETDILFMYSGDTGFKGMFVIRK